MKHISQKSTLIAVLFIVTASIVANASAQQGMEISKQQFIDMSLNMAEKAGAMQKQLEQQTQTKMREKLGEEQYQKYAKEEQQAEVAAEQKLATCLGISRKKLKSFEKTMGVEFQTSVIEKCGSKLPDVIKMGGSGDPMQTPELAGYVSCVEDIAVKETGIPAEKIKSCAAAQAQ